MPTQTVTTTASLTCDLGIEHTSCATLADAERKTLLKQVKAGEIDELEFDEVEFDEVASSPWSLSWE